MGRFTANAIRVLVLLLPASAASAQGPPIHTDTPIMLGLQGRGLRTFVKIVEREDRMIVQWPVVVPYNLFSDRFQLGVIAPFVTTTTTTTSSSGLGDARLFGKMLLVQRDRRNETFRVAAKTGIKLPTGNERAATPRGTGSTDYFASVVAGWIRGRTGVYGELGYDVNTSTGLVDFGNALHYNAAFALRLAPVVYETYPEPQVNLFLELNGSTRGASRRARAVVENTGGSTLFVSPGLQYVGGRRWLVEASVQLPVWRRLNGTQPVTSWTSLLGVRLLLF